MKVLTAIFLLMGVVGLFTNHIGAGLIAFVCALCSTWAYNRLPEPSSITDDDIDPRIKS
jgi:hypothetical protein